MIGRTAAECSAAQQAQVDPRVLRRSCTHEGNEQHAAAQQQRVDHAGIEPVEPVALIERRIQQTEASGA